MGAGFGLTPTEKDVGRKELWTTLEKVSKVKRFSRNIDKRPDPEGEAFIITRDRMLTFHTGKENIDGWVIRKKISYGCYRYEFYRNRNGWLYSYIPTDEREFEHITEGTTMCSWIAYTASIYETVTKQYSCMPRYDSSTYASREAFETMIRTRIQILEEYISEIKKAQFYRGEECVGSQYLKPLESIADMMRTVIDSQLPVQTDIEHLTSVPIEGIVRVEKYLKGERYEHLTYVNADCTEKKYANALFEAVVDLKANFPSLSYKRRFFDDPRYKEHLKPIKDMIDYFARYEGHFRKERCISFIHGRDPHSFTQLAANMQKFYLIYRKKRLAYTAYICSEKIKA
jgi:hypothetical protein